MIKTNIKTTRYSHGLFWIDIIENEDEFEAWLTLRDCGISTLMFGVPISQEYGTVSYDVFIDEVEANLDTYVKMYLEDYGKDK